MGMDDGDMPADNALLALAMWEYAQASGERLWQQRALQLLQTLGGDYDPTLNRSPTQGTLRRSHESSHEPSAVGTHESVCVPRLGAGASHG
jgi:hypothetical protein